MGLIKEPNGIDFVIKSRSLTKEEEVAISNYIRSYKAKHLLKQRVVKRIPRTITTRKKATAQMS